MHPVIRISCLPEMGQKKLGLLFQDVVAAAIGIEELGIKDEHGLTVLFPKDMMKYGLGEDIIIEILFRRDDVSEKTKELRNRLERKVARIVKEHCPKASYIQPY